MNTKEKIKAIMQADIDREQIGIDIYNVILGCVRKMEGQKITKRIATAVKEALPDYTVYYQHEYGMYNLLIWGKTITYEKRMSLLLGYDESNCCDKPNTLRAGKREESHSGFAYYSTCYGEAAEERNKKRRAIIASDKKLEKIASIVDTLKKSHAAFWALDDEIEGIYAIQKAFSLPDQFAR